MNKNNKKECDQLYKKYIECMTSSKTIIIPECKTIFYKYYDTCFKYITNDIKLNSKLYDTVYK